MVYKDGEEGVMDPSSLRHEGIRSSKDFHEPVPNPVPGTIYVEETNPQGETVKRVGDEKTAHDLAQMEDREHSLDITGGEVTEKILKDKEGKVILNAEGQPARVLKIERRRVRATSPWSADNKKLQMLRLSRMTVEENREKLAQLEKKIERMDWKEKENNQLSLTLILKGSGTKIFIEDVSEFFWGEPKPETMLINDGQVADVDMEKIENKFTDLVYLKYKEFIERKNFEKEKEAFKEMEDTEEEAEKKQAKWKDKELQLVENQKEAMEEIMKL